MIKNFFTNITGFIQYHFASMKNHYPCKLVAEKATKDKDGTVILYRILGKRDVFEISIEALLNDPSLLQKFHPTEAVKFGAIAMGDILFKEAKSEKERKQKFDEIKTKMLNSIG